MAALLPGAPLGWCEQVHGAGVVVVERGLGAGRPGDCVIARGPGCRPAMFAADCALVGLSSPEGLVAAVHVGWHGLLAGVVERAAAALRQLGATSLEAVRGPCIGPECYEFSERDLEALVRAYGPSVAGSSRAGHPALDLPEAVRLALSGADVLLSAEVGSCTACAVSPEGGHLWFSHRARRDAGRQALVMRAEGSSGGG